MPAARPSQASITNVIASLVQQGLVPGAVAVDADGGFVVQIQPPSLRVAGDVDRILDKSEPPGYED
jgi:hypothetical protein